MCKAIWCVLGFRGIPFQQSVYCAYGRDARGATRKPKNPTLKEKFQCRFQMRYSYVSYGSSARKNLVPVNRFQCKVTTCVYEHVCPCTAGSFLQAQTVSHKSIPKPENMRFAVELLWRTPHVTNEELKDCLDQHVPHHLYLSAKNCPIFDSA